jgi:RHS repeat-associated protein
MRHRPRRPRKPASYRPELLPFETREAPINLLATPGAVVGAAAYELFAVASQPPASAGSVDLAPSWADRHQTTLQLLTPTGAGVLAAPSPTTVQAVSVPQEPAPAVAPPADSAATQDFFTLAPVTANPVKDPLQPPADRAPVLVSAPNVLPIDNGTGSGGGSSDGGPSAGGDSGGGGGSTPQPTGPEPPAGNAPPSPGVPPTLALAQPSIAGQASPAALTLATNAGAALSPTTGTSQPPASPPSTAAVMQQLASQPVAFALNVGQTDPQAKVIAHGPGYNFFLTGAQAVFTLPRPGTGTPAATPPVDDVVAITFAGADPNAAVVPQDELAYRTNYFQGGQAFTDVPNYSRVTADLYPGVSVAYYGTSQTANQLEYDITAQPGADLAQVRMTYQGVSQVTIDAQGNLVLTTPGGTQLTQHAPVLYQLAADGSRQPVTGAFQLLPDGSVGFTVGAYDPTLPLVVDPTMAFSSFLGGSSGDAAFATAVDGNGRLFLTGSTASTNFPTVSPFIATLQGTVNTFVSKFNATGSALAFSTYLGASGSGTDDRGTGIAVDPAGNPVVVGLTDASNYPTSAGAVQTTGAHALGLPYGYVTRLNATGSALLYSSFLDYANPYGVALDALGEAVVTGAAWSGFTTTAGAYQGTDGGSASNAFCCKLAADGTTFVYSTFDGGSGSDVGYGVALDTAGNAYLAGAAGSSNLPTTAGAAQTTSGGGTDAFLTKLNATGTALGYSTYIGGSGTDQAYGVAVDRSGNAYVGGSTTSSNLPTTAGAAQTTSGGGTDGFLTKVNAAGSAWVYSTYLGGSGTDEALAVAVTADGQATVTGDTTSSNLPTINALAGTSYAGTTTAFITRANAAGTTWTYSSYLGAGTGYGVAVDLLDDAYAVGKATSSGFPTTSGAFDTTYSSGDAFALKVQSGLAAPVLTGVSPDTGASSTDRITSNTALTLSGTAPASATVRLYKNDVMLGTTTANGSGAWTYSVTLTEGTWAFTARSESGGAQSLLSATYLVTVDQTAPTITLSVPASTPTFAPVVQVWASDLVGIPASATVTLDVDTNNDGNFTDAGEAGYATGSLVNGYAAIPVVLTATGTYRVRAHVSDLAGTSATGAASSFTITTVGSPWTLSGATVRTSELSEGNPLLQLGDLQVSHPLDLDKSPGTAQSGNPELVYNSFLVGAKPVIQAKLQTDNAGALPGTLTAQLTWDGTAQGSVSFPTTGFHKGDALTLAVQESTAITTTGRHDWSLTVTIPGHANATASGTVYVRAEDSSPLGAGWTLSTLNKLVTLSASGSDPAGELWLYGTGEVRFFQGAPGTLPYTFTSPAEDNGTLVDNTDGSFTYTAADGTKTDFNSSGYQTDWVSADGKESLQFRYTSGLLTGTTAIDGQLATLTYSSGLLSSVAVGSRTWTLTMTSGDLTQVTDPDSKTDALTYSTHKLTDRTQGILVNHWAYTTNGLLNTWRWGNSSSPSTSTLVSANARGLVAAMGGGQTPFLGDPTATWTDAVGDQTVSQMDSAGRLQSQQAADGGVSQWTRDGSGRVTVATDPLNRVTTYTRDALGYVTQETLPDGNTVKFAYQTAFHALTTLTNERNFSSTLGYDTAGHLTREADALGDVTTLSYDATTGLLTSIQDAMGRYTTYGYLTDGSRRAQTMTTVLGTTTLGYDSTTGEVATTTDPLSHTTTVALDNMGRPTSRTTADGYSESWSYNTAGLLDTHTDKAGVQDQTVYDTYGRGLVDHTVAGLNTPVARSAVFGYDNAGRTIAISNELGDRTQLTLDPVGRTVLTTDPIGNSSRAVYDLAGQLTDAFDAMGAHTHLAYNARGWVTAATDPRGGVVTSTFDAAGNRTVAQDQLGHAVTVVFDALDRVGSRTDPLNHTVSTTYWADSTVKTVTDARGFVTSTTNDLEHKQIVTTRAVGTGVQQTTTQFLDAAGNVIASQNGLGNLTTLTLDAVNQVVATTDPLSHVSTVVRDAMSRVTSEIDPLGKATTLTLDKLGEAVKTTDPTSKTSQSVYDGLSQTVASLDGAGKTSVDVIDPDGRIIVEIDADGNKVRSQFDADGRRVAYTDALGNQTVWEYDLSGNPTKMTDANGGSVTWAYDAANRQTGTTDRLGRSKAETYLANNLLQTEVWKDNTGTPVNTLNYSYNEDNQVLTAGDSSGTYTFTLDALGREVTQKDVWNLTLTLGYDQANRETSVADSLGGLLTNTYDTADRVTARQFTDASSHALSVTYTYSTRDQVTGSTRYSDATETTSVGTSGYGYDDAGRLTSATFKDGSGTTLDALTYTYDLAGRVATETSVLGPSKSYSYDDAGQVLGDGTNNYTWDAEGNSTKTGFTTTTGNRLSTDGTWNYTYDAEGNETQKTNISNGQVWLYYYDNDNRLTKAEHKPSSGGSVDERILFKYDVFGNRIEKDVDPTGGGTYTTQLRMAYDGNGNAWADLDGTNSNALLTRRLYADAVDALFARIGATSGTAWYLDDLLGSVRDIAGSTGSLIDTKEYDAFGNLTSETHPTSGDRYGWTGREFDTETNVQYNRARYYDPKAMRWMSQDPKGFDAGDSNLYRYVENGPVYARDPSGLQDNPPNIPNPEYPTRGELLKGTYKYMLPGPEEKKNPPGPLPYVPNPQVPSRGDLLKGTYKPWLPGPGGPGLPEKTKEFFTPFGWTAEKPGVPSRQVFQTPLGWFVEDPPQKQAKIIPPIQYIPPGYPVVGADPGLDREVRDWWIRFYELFGDPHEPHVHGPEEPHFRLIDPRKELRPRWEWPPPIRFQD